MRTAATPLAALAALAPSLAHAAPPAHARPSELIPRFVFQAEGPLAPTVTFTLRTAPARDDPMLGRSSLRIYRGLPEVMVSLRPEPGVQLFCGVGAGAAYVIGMRKRHRVRETDLALSGSFGVRVVIEGIPLTASVRGEALVGQGAAVMLRLKIELPDGRRR